MPDRADHFCPHCRTLRLSIKDPRRDCDCGYLRTIDPFNWLREADARSGAAHTFPPTHKP
jgi:hypothetical protein